MDERLTKRMEIRLSQKMKKDVVSASRKHGISIGEVFRTALKNYIEKGKRYGQGR